MHIAVLSDTHNQLPSNVFALLNDADEVWHLGDVTDERCLAPLHQMGKSLYIVRGNCDSNLNWPWVLDLEREGYRVRLTHIPPAQGPAGIDLLFHGHTHLPRCGEWEGETRFYNPGSVGKPNKGAPASFAWLDLEEGKPPKWEIVVI